MASPTAWFTYLSQARWFQAKGLATGIDSLEPCRWLVQEPDCWVRSELAVVRLPEGQQTYHLIVGYLPRGQGEPEATVAHEDLAGFGPADVVDAPQSARARQALWAGLTVSQDVTWLVPGPDRDSVTDVFRGEQSNTNLAIGDEAIAKLLRKLTQGRGLDGEILAALNGSGITPTLLGVWRDEARDFDLGLITERVADATDGWDWATAACRDDRSVTAEMEALGGTLRRLHRLLAQAFPVTPSAGTALSDRLRAHLASLAAELPELAGFRPALERDLDALAGADVAVQRIHGDFHLGQTLLTPRGWTILDFEGEPLKTPAERRAPDSGWRDVAGLTRSIDYARSRHREPDSAAAVAWAAEARRAFLAGYAAGEPIPGWLAAYEADKAAYELLYETRNRPDWVEIPRRALASLAGTADRPVARDGDAADGG